jgi:hypothetical protein
MKKMCPKVKIIIEIWSKTIKFLPNPGQYYKTTFSGNNDPEKDAEFDALLSAKKPAANKTPKRKSENNASSSSSAKKPKAAKKPLSNDEDSNPPDSPAPASPLVSNHASTRYSKIFLPKIYSKT